MPEKPKSLAAALAGRRLLGFSWVSEPVDGGAIKGNVKIGSSKSGMSKLGLSKIGILKGGIFKNDRRT